MLIRLFVFFLVLSSGLSYAQEAPDSWRISAVSFGSGENPITSGIFGTVQLKNGGCGFAEITAQEQQAWFMHGCDYALGRVRMSTYWSVGHQQGAPWVGPYISATVPFAKFGDREVSLGVLTWPGFFLGREPHNYRTEVDGVENPEGIFAGYFSIGSLNIGPASLTITHLNFLDSPTDFLYGVGYTRKLTQTLEVNGSANWDRNAERLMYFVGATWRRK